MTVTATNDQRLGRVVAILKRFPEVRRVILFGSWAIGDWDERSDIDIVVSAPGIDFRRWAVIAAVVDEARTLLRIDLVWLEDASEAFALENGRTGRVIFERA